MKNKCIGIIFCRAACVENVTDNPGLRRETASAAFSFSSFNINVLGMEDYYEIPRSQNCPTVRLLCIHSKPYRKTAFFLSPAVRAFYPRIQTGNRTDSPSVPGKHAHCRRKIPSEKFPAPHQKYLL